LQRLVAWGVAAMKDDKAYFPVSYAQDAEAAQIAMERFEALCAKAYRAADSVLIRDLRARVTALEAQVAELRREVDSLRARR